MTQDQSQTISTEMLKLVLSLLRQYLQVVQKSLNVFKLSVVNAIHLKEEQQVETIIPQISSHKILDKEFVIKLLKFTEQTKKPKKLKKQLNIILNRYKSIQGLILAIGQALTDLESNNKSCSLWMSEEALQLQDIQKTFMSDIEDYTDLVYQIQPALKLLIKFNMKKVQADFSLKRIMFARMEETYKNL